MAKKIRLDFSKVEERSGWNTKHIGEGLHKMKIESCQQTEAGDGTAMLVYALVPEQASLKTRRFPYYCKLQQNQLWKLRDLIVAAGGSVPKRATQIDPDSIVGKFIAAEVEDDNFKGTVRSQVNGTYGLEILTEDDDSEPDDDEEGEDEEFEEGEEPEEDDEEYEDEAEDEEEDEEAEDLTLLSLAELRKMAKELGVDTAGLKKAQLIESIEEESEEADEEEDEDELEEDDLTDEDLEDEEFEDEEEEEEPAPAPKRRVAAKAPVRKAAPAKAAPAKAAPAKRVIKRR